MGILILHKLTQFDKMLKCNPMETMASIQIGREITFPENDFAIVKVVFDSLARNANYSRGEKKSLQPVKYNRTVRLLSTGYLMHFHRANDLPLDGKVGEELADYLDETLPDAFDRPLVVPTFPLRLVIDGDRHRILTLGVTEVIHEERAETRAAIAKFYAGKRLRTDSWLSKVHPNGYEFAHTNHEFSDDVADLAVDALQLTEAHLPKNIIYQPAVIDRVDRINYS